MTNLARNGIIWVGLPIPQGDIGGEVHKQPETFQSYQACKPEDSKLGSLVAPSLITPLHQQTYIPGEKLEGEVIGAFGEGF